MHDENAWPKAGRASRNQAAAMERGNELKLRKAYLFWFGRGVRFATANTGIFLEMWRTSIAHNHSEIRSVLSGVVILEDEIMAPRRAMRRFRCPKVSCSMARVPEFLQTIQTIKGVSLRQ